MDRYTFMDAFIEKVTEKIGPNYQVETQEVWKNNGVRYEGLYLREKGGMVTPILSLDQCYRQYQTGASLEKIVDEALLEYGRQRENVAIREADFLQEYETVKDRLYIRLVNRRWNQQYLEDKCHIPFLDLAAVYCIDLQNIFHGRDFCRAGLTVTKNLYAAWGVSRKEIHQQALKNMEQNSRYVMDDIHTVLGLEENVEPGMPKLWVLQDKTGHNSGATALLYREIMERAAEKLEGGFYILPSSVYEVLLLPEHATVPVRELKEMVQEVNRQTEEKEDLLSEHVYHYNKEEKKLTIAE